MTDRASISFPSQEKTLWTGLTGSSPAFVLADLTQRAKKPFFVVCANEDNRQTLLNSIQFFQKLLFPGSSLLFSSFPARPTDLNPSRLHEPQIAIERLKTLFHLLQSPEKSIVITSLEALSQVTLPQSLFVEYVETLQTKTEVDRDLLIKKLFQAGYEKENLVYEPGFFSVRGSILDLFPSQAQKPYRIEFLGDKIESIRSFSPSSQRSLEAYSELTWMPCREFLFTDQSISRCLQKLKPLADERNVAPASRLHIEHALEEQRYQPVMNSFLPLFYEKPSTIFDFAPSNAHWALVDPFSVFRELKEFPLRFKAVEEELLKKKSMACGPGSLFVPPETIKEKLHSLITHTLSDVSMDLTNKAETLKHFSIHTHEDLRQAMLEKRKSENPIGPLIQTIQEWVDHSLQIVLVAENEAGAQRIQQLISPHLSIELPIKPLSETWKDQDHHLVITYGHLHQGFVWDEQKLVILTEPEIFGKRKHASEKKISGDELISSLRELEQGDPVVHIDHGIGIFQGLKRIQIQNVANDFLHLEYADGDKLFLPIYRLNQIHRYIGTDRKAPQVDRLGNQSKWSKTRAKAKKAIEEMAQELIELYATRKVSKGISLARADQTYLAFEADFPFEETRDQLRTLEDVSVDLESEKPMDRLVCGDVGFGKTEIALRAAFRTAMEGKQVGVLVPTTILAQQHYETFKQRFSPYPIEVDFLSRFKSSSAQKKTVSALKSGTLDIVIGTHRLLSKDISFANLGLLIVDEEHRFGVKHKEQIKQYRNRVNVLTLTATPIPRTLQLSMAGIRDLSVINTAPLDRKSVQTYLCNFEDAVIQGAIHKELERQGQVFFVHNRVETIAAMHSYLKRIVPKARIEVAHGQMPEKKLEETMLRFLQKEFDVLLCTSIIESGLDISLANTILINRADCFGLAQLYQLRGRVGRSDRSAFAYLLVPGEEIISRDALKRLKALKRFTELGSGLKIALRDLEIRGAGNLLGKAQSGHIAGIGFELYTQLLDREVRRLKGEKIEEELDPEIQCMLPAYLPETYITDSHERLVLYKRFSSVKNDEEINTLQEELEDRFGKLPLQAENLLRVVSLKALARKSGVASLQIGTAYPSIEFTDRAPIDINRLLAMVKKDPRIRLTPNNRLVLNLEGEEDNLDETKKILLALCHQNTNKEQSCEASLVAS